MRSPARTSAAERSRVVPSCVEKLSRSIDNDLQQSALSLRPDLQARLDALVAAGALGAAVSGSGPTCFGLFADRPAAEHAAERLPGALVTALR